MKKYLDLLKEYYENLDQRTRIYWGIGIAAVLLFVIIVTTLNERIAVLEKRRKARENDLVEMMVLKQRFLSARLASQRFAGRLSAIRADDSPAKIIEEIGITGKSSKVTPLKGEELGGFLEDSAEVTIEGLSLNEVVNLLYLIEKGARPIVIKKAKLKTRFDDPAVLDLTMTIALLKPSPKGQK